MIKGKAQPPGISGLRAGQDKACSKQRQGVVEGIRHYAAAGDGQTRSVHGIDHLVIVVIDSVPRACDQEGGK